MFHNLHNCMQQASYRLSDLAAEHMNPEDLCVVVALCEGEAVALWRAIVASDAEQNLINGVIGNFCVVVRVQQPDEAKEFCHLHCSACLNKWFLNRYIVPTWRCLQTRLALREWRLEGVGTALGEYSSYEGPPLHSLGRWRRHTPDM